MAVDIASTNDLQEILGWLEQEHAEAGEGFWCNRSIIVKSLAQQDLFVIRRNGSAVAFQVGRYAADIVCVRKDYQRQGLGQELFQVSLERAYADNVNVLRGECSPTSSLPFWQKLGFVECAETENAHYSFGVRVRRTLTRDLPLPASAAEVKVKVSFYPWRNANQPPIGEHDLTGSRVDQRVYLPTRVVGTTDDGSRDLVIRIEVENQEVAFCKAKYPEAVALGVRYDSIGESFYLDTIVLPATTE